MRYQGKLYRALNPVCTFEPISGREAELYGGRFNLKGVPTLYTSLTIITALKEANRIGNLQPMTLVSYDADIEQVFDCRNEAAVRMQGIDAAALADPTWRGQVKSAPEARTQTFARQLAADGYCGLIVKSFAPAATDDDINLVLWRWSSALPNRLIPIDDEQPLSR